MDVDGAPVGAGRGRDRDRRKSEREHHAHCDDRAPALNPAAHTGPEPIDRCRFADGRCENCGAGAIKLIH
jgi:hypothetical protein